MKFPGGSISMRLSPALWIALGFCMGAATVAYFWHLDNQRRAAQADALAGGV